MESYFKKRKALEKDQGDRESHQLTLPPQEGIRLHAAETSSPKSNLSGFTRSIASKVSDAGFSGIKSSLL